MVAVVLIAAVAFEPAVSAADKQAGRFAALRADEVNLRTGPGIRYPVDWVFQRRNLPVEILAAFDTWRQIRDFTGTVGWVHKSMLTGRRMVMVKGGRQKLFREPSPSAKVIAYVDPNVIARLLDCEDRWCGIKVAGYSGWMPRAGLWGVQKDGSKR